jgi:hypothetical protein
MKKFEEVEQRVVGLYGIDNYETNPFWNGFARYLVVGIALSLENYEELSNFRLKHIIMDYVVNDKLTEEDFRYIYFSKAGDFESFNFVARKRLSRLIFYKGKDREELLKSVEDFLNDL